MAAASSCSDIIPREKHDVFLSFRGEDTRNTFTSHLYEALCQKKIQTYIDYKLERGDEISPALLKAISESKLSVIIFSKNYASSTWCLDELVHILECRDKQFVIPIFYGIDPSHVRKQSGSYEDAFVEHEERFKDSMDKVLMWRDALITAADISGYDSQTIRPESELVKIVVNDILTKLNCKSQIASGLEGLVGIEKHIQQVELLLCLDSLDVQVVGIWGMGGIGKTTIADVVFHRLSFQFEACCFVANVWEASEKRGLNDLRNELFRTLLKEENICITTPSIRLTFMRERLCCTKALIVLDDVSDSCQLEFLVGGDCNLFGPGSRILVTTRNKRVLGNGVDGVDGVEIYEVKELDDDEALELFHLRAFGNFSLPGDYSHYTTSAKEVVDYAGGNPLALKILASVFSNCRSKEDWESELDKLRKFPNQYIQDILRLSYDGLHQNEKDIFLDIACYYKGECIDYAKRMLDASGFYANAGIRLLIDMSLISVNSSSRLEMHDLIQEMGQTIVLNQCIEDPGQRSRLWMAKDVCYVLQKNRGTKAIESLVMTMDAITDLNIKSSAFKKMQNLRLLKFERYWNSKCINLSQGLKCLPQALRILQWDGYPLKFLPSKFCPENLVELRMCESRLKRLWNKGLKINLGSLKRIDLSWSEHLADVSALIGSPNLESIYLACCTSLVQLPSSFQYLAKLTILDLDDCSNLKILPDMPGNLETLYLDSTAIEELPSSIWSLEKLDEFSLESCRELKSLPSSTCRLNSLQYLRLNGCLSLDSLPVELPSGLRKLYLSNCKSLGSLPFELPSGLKRLYLRNCKSLGSLPVELPSGLEYLELSNCKSLLSLPVDLPSGLEYLGLSNCKSLGCLPFELPSGLKRLYLRNCKSLGSLPVKLPSGLEYLDLSNCKNLGSLPAELPCGLKRLYLCHCKSLGSLPKLPWLLKELDAHGCTSLETVSSSMRTARRWDSEVMCLEEHIFINCLKLDQSARNNIMADAELTAYSLRHYNKWSGIRIVCPGNEIPKWLRYQSEGCSTNINLPPHWLLQDFLGYALCIVLAFNNYTPPPDIAYYSSFEIHYKTNNGHEGCWEALRIRLPDILINSDHVFVWYFCPEYAKSESAINREDWVKASEASFDFMLYKSTFQNNSREKNPLDLSTVRVKRCGVSLLYAEDFENLLGGIDEDVAVEPKQVVEEEEDSLRYAQDFENLLGGFDEDVVVEPKQVVEEEDIIIKTKRRRDESELSGSGTASFKEEDDDQLLPQSSKRKINIF